MTLNVSMNSRLHDEARVISAKYALTLTGRDDLDTLTGKLVGEMESVNRWAEENDVIIGHLKGYLTWGDEALMLSTTGGAVDVKGSKTAPVLPAEIEAGMAMIIFGVELREAEKHLEALVSATVGEFGHTPAFEYEGEHVCDETCDHGHDHHDHDHDHDHHGHDHHDHGHGHHDHDHHDHGHDH